MRHTFLDEKARNAERCDARPAVTLSLGGEWPQGFSIDVQEVYMIRRERGEKSMELWTADGTRIAGHVRLATSFGSRCVGVLRFSSMSTQDGLLLSPGGSVHTMGLRFPIDVVFLSRQMRILGLTPNLRPWRFHRAPAGTGRTLELAAGRIHETGLKLGTFVVVESIREDDETPPTVVCRKLEPRASRVPCQRLPIQFSLRLPLERRCIWCGGTKCSTRCHRR